MKKYISIFISILLVSTFLMSCKNSDIETTPIDTTASTEIVDVLEENPETSDISTETPEDEVSENEEDIEYEVEASTYYIETVYAEQIGRYYKALSEAWDEGKYFENNMSSLPAYYYEGNSLDNVGFGFADLNHDGYWELIIGAILNADIDPIVFEIWTLADGEPVMIAQSGHRNRYYLQYTEEDDLWAISNEGENGAANHAIHYLVLNGTELNVSQAIIFDAIAGGEENPWFMGYDMDWDVSNDTPIDENTALSVIEANKNAYTFIEYFPYWVLS